MAEVMQRIRAYENAGADAICLVGANDLAQLEALAEGLRIPLMLVTYGNPQLRNNNRMAELGVRIVVSGHAPYFAMVKATYDSLGELCDIAVGNGLNASQLVAQYTRLDG